MSVHLLVANSLFAAKETIRSKEKAKKATRLTFVEKNEMCVSLLKCK